MGRRRTTGENFLLFTPMILLLLYILIPFAWTIILSLKDNVEIMSSSTRLLPERPTFNNYVHAWTTGNFSRYFLNTLFTSSVSLVFVLIFSILNGYALSRYNFKGKRTFAIMLIATQIMPTVLLIVPLFVIFNGMGLINTHLSLIIFYTARQLPFNAILMRSFINGISITLEEAAWVDGCGRIRGIIFIVIPLLLPGIVASGVIAFVGTWNEFMIPFSFLTRQNLFPIPVALRYLIGEFTINFGALAASSVIALIPPVIMFAYVQKFLISGLSRGGIKG
jgi:multiple sugar transport system permease protein